MKIHIHRARRCLSQPFRSGLPSALLFLEEVLPLTGCDGDEAIEGLTEVGDPSGANELCGYCEESEWVYRTNVHQRVLEFERMQWRDASLTFGSRQKV